MYVMTVVVNFRSDFMTSESRWSETILSSNIYLVKLLKLSVGDS